MAGNSGYVDFIGTDYSSTQTLRVYWQETVADTPGATSTVAITKVQLASESYIGSQYYADFVIQVNGTTVIDCREGVSGYTGEVYLSQFNVFTDVKRGDNQLTGSVSGIAHDSQGKKSINITLAKNPSTGYSYGGFWRMGAHFEFTKTSVSKAITLHQIPVGTLSISAGTGSTISVTRSGTALSAGANLWYGQSLVITFGASTGYTLNAHTVNGSAFTSGGTHTVTGNVAVAATASRSISTISASNGTFGVAQTITVTRYISTAKHTIYATCAGQTQTIVTKGTALSVSWTPAVSIMNSIMTAMSASCTLTINTYDANDNYLGAFSITITLALPTSGTYSVKPTPSITDSDANGYKSTFGGYVAGKSVLSVAIADGLKYSATMANRSSSANGVSSGAASFNAGTLTQNTTISTTVKDSRGQTGTASKSISVLAYTSPSITTFAVRRTDSSGNADDMGDYFTVSWAVAITALNNINTRSLKLRYKRVSATAWTEQTITLSAYSASGTTSLIAASGDYSFDVQLVLADYFETTTKATKLSTAAVVESRRPQGKGVAFSKVAETDGAFDIGSWNAIGRVLGLGQARAEIPANADLNDYVEPGVYGVANNTIAGTLANRPIANAGTLRVWDAMGSAKNPGDTWYYVMQEYVDYRGNIYMRYAESNSSTTVSWGAWFEFIQTGTSRTANTVLAAPNGSAGGASFRALVAADLPTVPITKGGTGATTGSGALFNLVELSTITLTVTDYGTTKFSDTAYLRDMGKFGIIWFDPSEATLRNLTFSTLIQIAMPSGWTPLYAGGYVRQLGSNQDGMGVWQCDTFSSRQIWLRKIGGGNMIGTFSDSYPKLQTFIVVAKI